jgi:hypothetical protein
MSRRATFRAMTIVTTHYPYSLMIAGIFGLLAAAGPTLGADTFDGTYTGKRVLTEGSPRQCIPSENVSVTINGEVLRFTDSALHNYAIGFAPHPDGSFGSISTGNGGGAALIRGRIVGSVLDADVTNGPCEHHWHLTKVPS